MYTCILNFDNKYEIVKTETEDFDYESGDEENFELDYVPSYHDTTCLKILNM